ncbi:efflux RND transporter periplasmic adaptor subunit [Parafrankia sp. BMG5.11]|uniref:efflux RND transporter periplasmic adaptor subunit n=1 Tax=Parafrankia sp. BMG5.11 TaxID=222540 RepID=UPI001039C3F4|nr:biotin/lipoyl-binding protein [Parafrankia sp. BMG5.11]TCJ35072.1 biotin/lipoyl-binding protein [Parafrankia sp. BMG5.11]
MTSVGRLAARRRPLVALAVVIVVAVAAGITIHVVGRGGSSDAAATVISRTVTAEIGTIKQSISTTGTIAPATQADLTFPASGKVTGVLVSEGDTVTTGQQLATIDSASLAASLAQAKLTLANGQEKLASDQTAGASSEQLAADQASVTTATDGVTAAQTALAGATMTSPVNGVVVSVSLVVGQQVSGSSSGSGSGSSGGGSGASAGGMGASGGTSAGSGATSTASTSSSGGQITVISTDSWIVNASVDSNSVGLIAKGNQATIVPGSGTATGVGGSGGAGGTIYGTVSSVGLIASSSGQTASFPVVIKVTGSPGGLHAGDTATVALIYKQLSNVLVLPTAAISQENGKSVVRVVSGTTTTTRAVTTGVSGGGSTEIVSGLSEGDQVLVEVAGGAAGPGGSGGGTGSRTGGQGYGGGGFPAGGFPSGGGFPGSGGN